MKAMILAAGLGKRMRPLTLDTPKPLLKVAGIPLIEYHIRRLVDAGFNEIVINHAWLGDKIEAYLGTGERFGADISYSQEDAPLETAGGIRKALPLLVSSDDESFLVVNGDVFTNYPFAQLASQASCAPHVVLVNNPEHNPAGDFFVNRGKLDLVEGEKLTFSGVSVLPASMFAPLELGAKHALGPILRNCTEKGLVSAERYDGFWADIGTPERLKYVDTLVREHKIDGF